MLRMEWNVWCRGVCTYMYSTYHGTATPQQISKSAKPKGASLALIIARSETNGWMHFDEVFFWLAVY